MRLSENQRLALQCIHASETPTDHFPAGLPLYVEHLPRELQFGWNSVSERKRWLENLQTRGLITMTGSGGCFLRLTDLGRYHTDDIDRTKSLPLQSS